MLAGRAIVLQRLRGHFQMAAGASCTLWACRGHLGPSLPERLRGGTHDPMKVSARGPEPRSLHFPCRTKLKHAHRAKAGCGQPRGLRVRLVAPAAMRPAMAVAAAECSLGGKGRQPARGALVATRGAAPSAWRQGAEALQQTMRNMRGTTRHTAITALVGAGSADGEPTRRKDGGRLS